MEDGLRDIMRKTLDEILNVLILVVMEDGLRDALIKWVLYKGSRLNPCCYGRWSQS